MKIDGVQNKPISRKSSTKKSGDATDISFVSFLEGQLNPLEETPPPVAAKNVDMSPSVSSSTRLDGLVLSENTIDTLESFSQALADLSLSSENMRPLVDALEEETTALLDIKEQLDADDPLAVVLDRVAAVAYLETEKYRRGDYDKR